MEHVFNSFSIANQNCWMTSLIFYHTFLVAIIYSKGLHQALSVMMHHILRCIRIKLLHSFELLPKMVFAFHVILNMVLPALFAHLSDKKRSILHSLDFCRTFKFSSDLWILGETVSLS